MADATENSRVWWIQAIQTLGVSTAAFFLLGFWANRTIEWERAQFLPALTDTKNAMVESSAVIRAVKETLDDINRGAKSDRSERRAKDAQ